jgi:hypothetical protein
MQWCMLTCQPIYAMQLQDTQRVLLTSDDLGPELCSHSGSTFGIPADVASSIFWKMLLSLSRGMQGASKGEEGGSGCQVVED